MKEGLTIKANYLIVFSVGEHNSNNYLFPKLLSQISLLVIAPVKVAISHGLSPAFEWNLLYLK
jgi:hypothetical protein